MQRTQAPKQKVPIETLTFGTTFTDHMFEVDWEQGDGWQAPLIRCVLLPLLFHHGHCTGGWLTQTACGRSSTGSWSSSPYGPIAMDPASSALHYALEVRLVFSSIAWIGYVRW